MFTVIVNLTVRPDRVEEFLDGIHANALASVRNEPGCLRFDVHRSTEHPHRFVLYEIYDSPGAFYTQHRNEPHYVAWRAVASRCVEPGGQVNTFAVPAFPDDVPEAPQSGDDPR
jgi:autoinducer 2-degrading protein